MAIKKIVLTSFTVVAVGIVAAVVAGVVLSRRHGALPVRTAPVRRVERLESKVQASGTVRFLKNGQPAKTVMRIDETDITRIRKGQSVTIRVNALPQAPPIAGRVSHVGLMALPARKDAEGRDFEVTLAIDRLPKELIGEMNCEADILTGSHENVLTVPIVALTVRSLAADAEGSARRHRKESSGVFVTDQSGLAHFRPVKTGLMADMDVEVSEGLEEGEEVITGPLDSMRRLEDGSRVRPETEADRQAAEEAAAKKEKKEKE